MQAFLTPKGICHEVNGIELMFYPISISTAFNLKQVARPLASSFATLMSDNSGDRGHTSMTSKGQDGEDIEQITVNPMSVELANLRASQKEKAILDFIEAFTEPRSTNVIIRVLMDSLRDEFPRKQEQQDVEDFKDKLDTSTTMQLLHGVMKANKGVFGPFTKRIEALIHTATAKVTVSQEPNESQEDTTEKTSSKTTTSGSESVAPLISLLTEDIPTTES